MTTSQVPALDRLRRTKLVCTLGPAVEGRVAELVGAGMDVARLNYSHGDATARASAVAEVRHAAARDGRAVALMADLAGPKIRIGDLEGGTAVLEVGAKFVLSVDRRHLDTPGTAERAGVTYAALTDDVRVGDTILLGDGVAELRAIEVGASEVVTTVVRGGTIRSRTGVAIPSERLSLGSLTDRDRADAVAAVELGCDLIALSFVRGPDDIRALREHLGPDCPPIIAKIETRPAIDRFDEILGVADGVMVARGDMGVELPYEDVPIVQKQLVGRALAHGVPSIVATQMLESMITAPRPTRAEASDVANAVLDGADAIMLSAETAIGDYPILAAQAAVRIIDAVEARGAAHAHRPEHVPSASSSEGVGIAAVALADADLDVVAIACFTRTGRTARVLAALRPSVPIVAFSLDPAVANRLALVHGVVPVAVPLDASSDTTNRDGFGKDESAHGRLDLTASRLAATGLVPAGASAVIVAAAGEPGSGPTLVELRRLP